MGSIVSRTGGSTVPSMARLASTIASLRTSPSGGYIVSAEIGVIERGQQGSQQRNLPAGLYPQRPPRRGPRPVSKSTTLMHEVDAQRGHVREVVCADCLGVLPADAHSARPP